MRCGRHIAQAPLQNRKRSFLSVFGIRYCANGRAGDKHFRLMSEVVWRYEGERKGRGAGTPSAVVLVALLRCARSDGRAGCTGEVRSHCLSNTPHYKSWSHLTASGGKSPILGAVLLNILSAHRFGLAPH